jgi:hypothetical protein
VTAASKAGRVRSRRGRAILTGHPVVGLCFWKAIADQTTMPATVVERFARRSRQ